jgi:hypothetical protein
MSLQVEFAGLIEQAQTLKRQKEEQARHNSELARQREERIALREALRESIHHLYFLAEKAAVNYGDIEVIEPLADQFLSVGQRIHGTDAEAILEKLPAPGTPETAHFLPLRFALSLLRAGLKEDRQTILDALVKLRDNPQLQAYFRWYTGLADTFCGPERAYPGSSLSLCAELPLPVYDCTKEAQQQCARAVGWQTSIPLERNGKDEAQVPREPNAQDLEEVDASKDSRELAPSIAPVAPPARSATLTQKKARNHQSSKTGDIASVGLELSDRQLNILQALYQLKAFSSESLQPTEKVVIRADGSNSNAESFREPIRELKQLSLICTKEGRRGGLWVTAEGRRHITHVRKLEN